MPQLIVSIPDSGDTTHDLNEAVITIGRISENLIQIEDASVSSRHAQLTLDESGDYILRDIGSTNGTELNGKEIAPEEDHKLQDGDKLVFGKIMVAYSSENPADARPLPQTKEVTAAVAEKSARPADFANASPFQKRQKKKDTAGAALIAVAVLAMAAFGYAVWQVQTIQPPAL